MKRLKYHVWRPLHHSHFGLVEPFYIKHFVTVRNGASDSRLTGGGSLNLVDLVKRKVPVEWKMGAANRFH